MFGYIVADMKNLTEEEKKRYNAYYCGLCHALKKTNGNLGRLTLTYDFTFIGILLCELYGEGETCRGKCAPHPCKTHDYVKSDILDYVADMNVLLSYANMLDDWESSCAVCKRFLQAQNETYQPPFPKTGNRGFRMPFASFRSRTRGADESRHSRRRFRTAVGHSSELSQR